MSDVLHYMGEHGGQKKYAFHCPGCNYSHVFDVPRWSFNGSLEKPTFSPSLLVNQHDPKSRCHSFVENGNIRFLKDCFHALASQTVPIPEWDI